MNKFLPLFIFIFTALNAQNQRFIYEYRFIIDSTDRSNVEKELTVLDVTSKGSEFYSYQKFKMDSLASIDAEKQQFDDSDIINTKHIYRGKINYTVSKIYPSFETYFKTFMGSNEYKVSDDRKPVWKILPEKEKIGEFHTQKAETEIFGRKWTAWFTAEIPIQDGPYKFQGLPGLILKLSDKNETHAFELKGIAKIPEKQKLKTDPRIIAPTEVVINQKQFQKLYVELRNDPGKTLRELLNQNEAVKVIGEDGKEVDIAEILRKRETQGKELRAKNNNILELDMIK